MPSDASEQVKPYLDEIADRLWSNNAAVMVGAGFSQKDTCVTPIFPAPREATRMYVTRHPPPWACTDAGLFGRP